MKKVTIFNYRTKFTEAIKDVIGRYNAESPNEGFIIDMRFFEDIHRESEAGETDLIIHTGGDGRPVKEDVWGVPKLYICHSHEWKVVADGGRLVQLSSCINGVRDIKIVEDDDIVGVRGNMPIMKYHELGVITPPRSGRVIAVSRAIDESGNEVEIIEAVRYDDGSVSIQGHPEEGTAVHIIHRMLDRVSRVSGQGTSGTDISPEEVSRVSSRGR